MIGTLPKKLIPRRKGQPTYEMAALFPPQGLWSESDYLDLDTERWVELSNGFLEMLPMPSEAHQDIVLFLVEALKAFVVRRDAGKVLMTGLRVKLWDGTIREPDVVFMSAKRYVRRDEYWLGADLVMEVLSPGGRERDLVEKRYEYAKAGISEYWIVDPQKEQITVLKLQGKRYAEHGIFKSGGVASSVLLKGFAVEVAAVFSAAK